MTITYKDFMKAKHNCKKCHGISFVCKPTDGIKNLHECYLEECRVNYEKCDQRLYCPACKGSGNAHVEDYIPLTVDEGYTFAFFSPDRKAVFKNCDLEESCPDCDKKHADCKLIGIKMPVAVGDCVTFQCKECFVINKVEGFGRVVCLNDIKAEVREVGIINVGLGISEHDLSNIKKEDVDKPHFKISWLQDSVLMKMNS